MGVSIDESAQPAEVRTIDACGLKCPLPTLRVETEMFSMKPGQIVDVIADCPTFEADMRALCRKRNIALLQVAPEGATTRVRIRI